MELLFFSLSCVFPFFVYLLIGYSSKFIFGIKENSYIEINKIALNVMMSINCFLSVYQVDFTNLKLSISVLFPTLGIFVIFIFSFVFYSKRNLSIKNKSIMAQATFNTNYLLLGIPLMQSILGKTMSEVSAIGLSLSLPMVNFLTVFIFVYFSNQKTSIKKLFLNVLTNPLIAASILGYIFNTLKITIPDLFMLPIIKLGDVTTPLALICLGGIFKFEFDKSLQKLLFELIMIRILIVPTIVLTIAIMIGLRGEDLALQLIVFSTPISVTSFSLSLEMNANSKLASQSLVFTTILSIFSMLVSIAIFKSLELL